LFPVIGKSPKGQASIEGRSYPMDGHGFARVTDFEVVDTSDTRCAMRMRDSTATRRSFPFAFELELSFELIGKTLSAKASVTNRDDRTMPFCFGFHPAFAWPLPGAEGSPHIVRLDNRQDPALLQIDADALLKP
ncbi:aldose 1-epimerase family protein, partial [Corallococcus exiguus]|nr:aldose 1-epimerase family protein [Corallococcus exiguus]